MCNNCCEDTCVSCKDIRRCETVTKLSLVNGVLKFKDEKGVVTTLVLPSSFDEHLTILSFDALSNTLYYLDEAGVTTPLTLNSILLQTNDVDNYSQSLLNLVEGENMLIEEDNGTVTFTALSSDEVVRFGLEDNATVENRWFDLGLYSFTIENVVSEDDNTANSFNLTPVGLTNTTTNYVGDSTSTFSQTNAQIGIEAPLFQITLPDGSAPGFVLTDLNGDGYATWEPLDFSESILRFGIEDNAALQDRYVDMGVFSFALESVPEEIADTGNLFVVTPAGFNNTTTNFLGDITSNINQTNSQITLSAPEIFLQQISETTQDKILYYDEATGSVTYGDCCAGGGGGDDTNFAEDDLTFTGNRIHTQGAYSLSIIAGTPDYSGATGEIFNNVGTSYLQQQDALTTTSSYLQVNAGGSGLFAASPTDISSAFNVLSTSTYLTQTDGLGVDNVLTFVRPSETAGNYYIPLSVSVNGGSANYADDQGNIDLTIEESFSESDLNTILGNSYTSLGGPSACITGTFNSMTIQEKFDELFRVINALCLCCNCPEPLDIE